MRKVRYGIIGFGKIGTQHAKRLVAGAVPACDLVAVADIDPKALESARAVIGNDVLCFDSAAALIHSGAVEAIHICTPHYFHPVYAIMGMEAGLHVLVEKPAGVYTRQVREMNEVAAKHPELVYALDFNQRTNPVYRKVREMIQEGVIGQIGRAIWIITDWYRSQSYYDLGGWRATWKGEGGGVLLNQNPHNLDLFQWICGMPSRIRSQVYYGKHRNIEVEDDVYAILEYPNGATGCYITTIADAPGTNRLEIDGDGGKIVVENNTITLSKLQESASAFNARFKGGLGKPACNPPEVVACEGTYTSHMGIIANFCAAILDHEPLLASGFDGINALSISNAIHLSSWHDGAWVELPLDENVFYDALEEKIRQSEQK